jgi:stage II sporulation protein D
VASDRGDATLHAADFRLALGASDLRSTYILGIERAAGGVVFKGGGWGHGVGLCQHGAMGMARKGYGAEEIVAHYYPGALVKRAY